MNTLESLREFFGWCAAINMIILVFVSVVLTAFKTPLTKVHGAITGLETKSLNKAYFNYMANYKIATVVFCLAPYLALKIMT